MENVVRNYISLFESSKDRGSREMVWVWFVVDLVGLVVGSG